MVKTIANCQMQRDGGDDCYAGTQQDSCAFFHGLDIFWILIKWITESFFSFVKTPVLAVVRLVMSPSVVTAASSSKKAEDQTYKKEEEKCFEKQEWDEEKDDPSQDPADDSSENLAKHGYCIYVGECTHQVYIIADG